MTFAFYSPTLFKPRNTHGDLTVIDFQTAQTDSMLNTRNANAERPPQATPPTETAGFNFGLDNTEDTEDTEDIEDPEETDPIANLHELQLHVPTITNSPRCVPIRPAQTSNQKKSTTPRRIRTVRVDAWAVPASANWSRTRTTVRKVNRGTRGTDWALPF